MYKAIDVSKHNGTINWGAVKNSGIEAVFIRGGYSRTADPMFRTYITSAKTQGLKVGVYWFSYAVDVAGARSEADYCVNLISDFAIDLGVFYDFEDDTERYAKTQGVTYTNASRTNIMKAFCDRVISKGYSCGLYLNNNQLTNQVEWAKLKRYPLWLAQWVNYGSQTKITGFTVSSDAVSTKWGKPVAWQFTSDGVVSGCSGRTDLNYVYENEKSDTYTNDDLTFVKCEDFKIAYHDANKRSGTAKNYINGGFFATYADANKNYFTLPVGNLVCDIDLNSVCDIAKKYVEPYVSNGKFVYTCNNNQTSQFKNKKVSTLIVPSTGTPYVSDCNTLPSGVKYAISGVPTVRNGEDVDYYAYVKTQGWDDSCMRATYRSWLGIRDGEIWLITGKTKTQNYIYGMEIFNKIKTEGFTDVICLDGGGSYYFKNGNKASTTAGTRQVNNIVQF